VPAAWFVPEWIGSGDPLRSGARARVPNPGQPALADVPALASLWAAAKLLWWPLWIGLAALAVAAARRSAPAGPGPARGAPRPALLLAAAGLAWCALVAAMAQAGFSGEPRYHLPGVALVSIAAVAAWRRPPPAVAAALAAALLVAAVPRVVDAGGVREAQAYQWTLQRDLRAAVDAAGGREAVLACGTPYVGPLRGPLMAYALRVTKRTVEPDAPPQPPGVVFRARLTAAGRPAPDAAPPFEPLVRAGTWQVMSACSTN
jgi:hypothetical protein